MNMNYSKQIQSPFWQRKRLEIMQKYNFQCQMCFDRNKMLNVHHKYYIYGKKAWEYENDCYILLCDSCHSKVHELENILKLSNTINVQYDINKDLNCTDISMLLKLVSNVLKNNSNNTIKEINKIILSQTINKNDI